MSSGHFRWASRSRALRMRAASPGEDEGVALHAQRCDMDSAGERRAGLAADSAP
jgi:hypothetical protein